MNPTKLNTHQFYLLKKVKGTVVAQPRQNVGWIKSVFPCRSTCCLYNVGYRTLHAGSDSCVLVSSPQEGGQEPGGQAVPRTRHCATPSHDFRGDFLKKNVRKRRFNISSCVKGTQAWEIWWLWFWILKFFIASIPNYFFKFIIIGEVTMIPRILTILWNNRSLEAR